MFQITGKKIGVIWDAQYDCPLATFKEGAFFTEDQELAEKLNAMGYDVEKFAPDPLSDMTVKELQAYAEEKGFNLGGVTKKSDILDAIQRAAASDNE